MPLAKNKETGEYSAALPGLVRDYLTGWADLITGPEVGQNLSPQAVLSILGPGPSAGSSPTSAMVIGPGARAFDWKRAIKSPIAGADDIARNVIDDSNVRFKDVDALVDTDYKMSDLVDHPELFENYPDLANKLLNFSTKLPKNWRGSHTPSENRIRLQPGMNEDDALGVLLHELQHGVQNFEGMQPGANAGNFLPEDFNSVKHLLNLRPLDMTDELDQLLRSHRGELSKLENNAYELYRRAPGEMEARATQNEYLAAIQREQLDNARINNGWASASGPIETPFPNLPFGFQNLDMDPSMGLAFDPSLRQQYSPGLAQLSKMLQEYLAK